MGVTIVNKVIPINKIAPHPKNYNQHPDKQIEQLGESYDELGQFNSIVVWERPGGLYTQVARQGFLTGMKSRGAKEIRADILPMDTDPLIIERILAADNLHAKNSITNETLLAELLQSQVDAGRELSGIGVSQNYLIDLLAKNRPPTLEELTAKFGDEPVYDAFWPLIHFKVPPQTKALYDELCEKAPQGLDEASTFLWILERVTL